MLIANIGCGQTLIEGAINIDNSFSVRVARIPVIRSIVKLLTGRDQAKYIDFAREHNITYGRAEKLPFNGESVDIIYSSHMIEHLDENQMDLFLKECNRCLKTGGVLRLVAPDLDIYFQKYNDNRDAVSFAKSTLFYRTTGQRFKEKLRMAFSGDREHKIMYNSDTLIKLLQNNEFKDVVSLKSGESKYCVGTNIDLSERANESLYVEAVKA